MAQRTGSLTGADLDKPRPTGVLFRRRGARTLTPLAEVTAMVNVGALDMLLRFLLAMGLFSLATYLEGDLRWLALLGFAPLLSAVFRFCPLYALLHVRSCSEADALNAHIQNRHVQNRIAH